MDDVFKLDKDKPLDENQLTIFIDEHRRINSTRFYPLFDAYNTDYPIFHEAPKPNYKPDNRIAVNFAKYIVDTMNGYFIGIPIKTTCDDEDIADYIEYFEQFNDQDDKNAELSKICSIYGRGYEMYYLDDDKNVCTMYFAPTDAFMVYDDSAIERPREFVRLYYDADGVLHGSVSDSKRIRYFMEKGKLTFEEEVPHEFHDVPATEYRENRERIGVFEPVLSMIHAYNRAISEKANDVDYFADAYLKVLGQYLDDKELEHIRDDRIINFDGDVDRLVVEFLQKPDGDTTQEHLIDRLEQLIFQISMVANISDENFGTSSGIALKYKLQAMSNLAKTKERKFISGMNRRYKVIFGHPITGKNKDDWVKLKYKFTPNLPANVLEESQIAANLSGITSQATQLSVLSVVDNVQEEIERIEAEEEKSRNDVVVNQMFGGAAYEPEDEPGVLGEAGSGTAEA